MADRIAALIVASFMIFGIVEVFAEDLAVLHLFVLAVLGFAWCKADVRARKISEPAGSAFLVGAVGALGVPIYFFRSKPWRQAFVSTALFLGFAVVCVAVYVFAASTAERWHG